MKILFDGLAAPNAQKELFSGDMRGDNDYKYHLISGNSLQNILLKLNIEKIGGLKIKYHILSYIESGVE